MKEIEIEKGYLKDFQKKKKIYNLRCNEKKKCGREINRR
jgi:hypothetical protein